MASRALVTGGAGCIGSDLVARLLDTRYEVVVFDNLSSGKIEHIQRFQSQPGFRFIEADLLDIEAVRTAMEGVDIVFHLAANPDVRYTPGEPTDKDLQQNTLCTYNVLEAMRTSAVRRLAFSSTSAVYGISSTQPIPESHPLRPISLYGATKASCEAMISAFHHLFDIDCWVFRFANIVGPKTRRQGKTVVGDFIDKLRRTPSRLQILGNGLQTKSYLLSEECVDAMLFAVSRAPRGMHVFNLGCNDQLCVRQIADMVVEAMQLPQVEYVLTGGEGGWLGDVPRFVLDVATINRLGWSARYNSKQAVELAIRATLSSERREAHCKQ